MGAALIGGGPAIIAAAMQMQPAPAHQPTFVLYHRDADGFASAFAAWCALGNVGVTYLDVQYGEAVPEIPDGARLFVVDFSYPREQHLEWARRGIEQTVLDHHKTAAAALEGLGFATFDMSRSGCELAWEYFSREENAPNGHACIGGIPWLLEAIADRDLWKLSRKNTREICARLELEPWDFERWLQICLRVPEFDFVVEGRVLLELQRKTAARQAKDWHFIELRGGRVVRACNATTLTSETAHALLEAHPEDEYVATYRFVSGKIVVSLRGRGTVDVSEIAKQYEGGGGHKNAAGFSHAFSPLQLVTEIDRAFEARSTPGAVGIGTATGAAEDTDEICDGCGKRRPITHVDEGNFCMECRVAAEEPDPAEEPTQPHYPSGD
jgi:oligoribonuclease NrnB/cAMP/cGMP phosphodiesterase (DHH superfamily)